REPGRARDRLDRPDGGVLRGERGAPGLQHGGRGGMGRGLPVLAARLGDHRRDAPRRQGLPRDGDAGGGPPLRGVTVRAAHPADAGGVDAGGEGAFGALVPRVRVRPPGPRSRALARRLRAVESRDVTWVGPDWPVFWEEARGGNVRDVDGNVLLDLTGAFGVGLLGHGHPAVIEAVARQARRLVHGMGDIHPPAVKLELLERLAALAPWPESRCVLSSTGSEAVETALKTAQVATGRPGIVAFEGAYHGLTLGSLAATDREHFRGRFLERLYGGVAFLPFPEGSGREVAEGATARTPAADAGGADPDAVLAALDRVLREGAPNGDPVGVVVVEPMQGRGGARVPP